MIRRFFTRFVALLIVFTLLVPQSADARRHKPRHVPKPGVHVVVPPPTPRPGEGWVWVVGRPGVHGVWIAPHWVHVGVPPRAGWIWVPGWWRAGVWVSGFWRPDVIVGYHWVEAGPGPDGTWIPGYWEPDGPAPEGMVWRPGYWTGSAWVPGRWVPAENYNLLGPDGEVEFFAVGDGHVEEVALPASEDVYDEQGAVEDGPGVLQHRFEETPPAEATPHSGETPEPVHAPPPVE